MLNLLTLTAVQARGMLEKKETTSVQLVEAYLAQIEKHNHQGMKLHAIISIIPREKTLETARRLDSERSSGQLRGPLHGIPFVCKDVFPLHPDLGVPCTAGAPCFETARAKRTAPLIQHLLDQGMILLGTANLTEFCGMKHEEITPGFSPVGGQTQSPYIFGGRQKDDGFIGHSSIGGSSAGSAASVAAGFAPLAIGTECVGSVMLPSTRGGVYALKCGLDTVDVTGAFRYTDITDFIGGMAKSAQDLSLFSAALMARTEPFDISGGMKGLKIGFVKLEEFRISDAMAKTSEETWSNMASLFDTAKAKFAAAGAQVSADIDLPCQNDLFKWKGKSLFYDTTCYTLRHKHFPAFFDELEYSEVRSVAEMIKWNVDHAGKCLPDSNRYQTQFYDLLYDRLTEEEYKELLSAFPKAAEPLLKALEKYDAVVGLGDSMIMRYTSASGCPVAAAPLGTVKYSETNVRPCGLAITAKRGNEGLLLRILAAFEELYPDRPLPRPLLES